MSDTRPPLHAVPAHPPHVTPAEREKRSQSSTGCLPTEPEIRKIHRRLADEIEAELSLEATVERVRAAWAADYAGHTPDEWFLLLASRVGRLADDLTWVRRAPEHPTHRAAARDALVEISAIAQLMHLALPEQEDRRA